jgi:G3E family GTPase
MCIRLRHRLRPICCTKGVFWLDDELESALYLDSVITIVDAKHIRRQLQYGLSAEERAKASAEGELASEERTSIEKSSHAAAEAAESTPHRAPLNEAQRQIAFADRLVINKTDLVDAEELTDIGALVGSINPNVQPLLATYGRVNLDLLLNIHAYDMRLLPEVTAPSSAGGECAACTHTGNEGTAGHTHTHTHGRSHHQPEEGSPTHLQDVAAHSVVHRGEVTEAQVNLWLADLLWEQGREDDVYRFKGQVAVAGEPQKYVLQGVHSLFELAPSGVHWAADEVRESRFVFIGRALDSAQLNQSFVRFCCEK